MKKSVKLPAHIKPERYEIMLRPNFEDFTFTGEETIFFSIDKAVGEITLHAVDLEIASESGKVSFDKKNETATIHLSKSLPKGKDKLKLTFKGILNDKMRGFYRSKYTHEEEVKHLVTTQFESTDARRAFPCFDEPHQKAIFDVTLMIPAHMTAISNTIESEIKEHEVGIKAVKFEPTPKMSTYLLAFIVGEFEYIEGKTRGASGTKNNVLVRVFTTPGKKEQGRFALDIAVKCMDFYEDYFGIPYPLPVLDMIAIPDFAAGAMENWGAVTYREPALLFDEGVSSLGNKQRVALVIAHELAHQWFGNLVTMEWWTHLWLNEGFASFIEYLAIDHIFPEWDIWTQFVGTEMADAYELDSLANTHPIEVEVGHPAEISEIFDRVSYSKGASVLRMLWQFLGPEIFRKGLQFYLNKYAYSNAKTEDLWQALEEISGKPVADLMKNWTAKAGHPLIRVKGEEKNKTLSLTQSRFYSSAISGKKSKDNTIWQIPLQIGEDKILMNKKSSRVSNKGEKLNKGEVSLVRIAYPGNYLNTLSQKKLSASDRLGLIRDSFDLAKSGESFTATALELALSFKNERDLTVWTELSSQLSRLNSLLAHEAFYPDFKRYGIKLYSGVAQSLGWDKKKGEKHTDSLLRTIVLNMLGRFGDQYTIQRAQSLFGKKTDPDLKSLIYNLTAENGREEEFKALIKMYKQEENQQEKDRLDRALGAFKIKSLLSKSLDFSISKDVRFRNTLQIIVSVWANPSGRYLAWAFVKKNWQLLKERYAGGHYFTKLFLPAGDFTEIADAKDIERFTAKHPVPEAKRTIAQALEQIYSNADWLRRDRDKIRKFLAPKA